MREMNLRPKAARRFKVTTDSRHNKSVAPNLLGQRYTPSAANTAWAADITYLRTDEGWLYLATVIDLYSRRIVGWSMGTRLLTGLVSDALDMAVKRRKPPQGIIDHISNHLKRAIKMVFNAAPRPDIFIKNLRYIGPILYIKIFLDQ